MMFVVIEWGIPLMYSNDDVQSLAFIKLPYLYEDLCFVYPLSVTEVIILKNQYDKYLRLLTLDRVAIIKLFTDKKVEIEPSLIPDPLDFLIESARKDNTFLLDLVTAFRTFIQEEVTLLYDEKLIVIGDPIDRRTLTAQQFSELSNIIRLQNNMPAVQPMIENEDPRAKHFREKRELRDAIKQKQESVDAPSLPVLMSALCAYGIGITPFNIGDLSLYTFYTLLRTKGNKEKYESDMECIYSGADPQKIKPKYWITNNI